MALCAALPDPDIELQSTTAHSLSVRVKNYIDLDLTEGDSGVLYQIFENGTLKAESGWVKNSEYNFDNLTPQTSYTIKVQGRNGSGRLTQIASLEASTSSEKPELVLTKSVSIVSPYVKGAVSILGRLPSNLMFGFQKTKQEILIDSLNTLSFFLTIFPIKLDIFFLSRSNIKTTKQTI